MESPAIYPVPGEAGRFHVASSGKADLLYLVDLDEREFPFGWCGCPHFEYRVGLELNPACECKHIAAARAYLDGGNHD
jgi:predicted nucleic acid-binding Zn finger protein